MAARPSSTAPLPAPTPASVTPPNLYPITEWPHAWPPIGGLRWLKFHAATNGFQSAFVKVGRCVLVDEGEFFACVARVNAAAKPPKRRSLTLPKSVEILDSQEAA